MITKLGNIKSLIIYLVLLFFGFIFLFEWKTYAANDILYQIMQPSIDSDNTIDLGNNVQTVWNKVIKGSFEASIGWSDAWVWMKASLIVKATRLLLILTIALSVTMILYNWMIYIIQTWQWKEWKSLMKNVLLIVIWILVALFSVVIINLIQSIPTTLDEELTEEIGNKSDNTVLKWKKMSWEDFWLKITNKSKKYEVIVNYVDRDTWKTVAPSKKKMYKPGDYFEFKSPAVTNYKPITLEKTGIVEESDLAFKVEYVYTPKSDDNSEYDENWKKLQEEAKSYYENNKIPIFTWIKDWKEVWYVELGWRKVDMIEAYLFK